MALNAGGFSRGQARAYFATELGEDFTRVHVYKTAYRYPVELIEERLADGAIEPYDGWPWWECRPGESGTDFWRCEELS